MGDGEPRRHVEPAPLQVEQQIAPVLRALSRAPSAEAAEQDKTAPIEEAPKKKRKTNRGSRPAHLPRVHITLAPGSTA